MTLVCHRLKVFLMGGTKIGDNANSGLYDVAQRLHLAGLAYACLEHSHLALLAQQPYREGHTYLRVVAARTARNCH